MPRRRRIKQGKAPDGTDYARKRAHTRRIYHERRNAWIALQGAICVRCGTKDPVSYIGQRGIRCDGWHLSHIDHTTKITHHVWTLSKEKREAELAKCELTCSSCNFDEANERHTHNGDGLEDAPF